jgi:hypothetical protein
MCVVSTVYEWKTGVPAAASMAAGFLLSVLSEMLMLKVVAAAGMPLARPPLIEFCFVHASRDA